MLGPSEPGAAIQADRSGESTAGGKKRRGRAGRAAGDHVIDSLHLGYPARLGSARLGSARLGSALCELNPL